MKHSGLCCWDQWHLSICFHLQWPVPSCRIQFVTNLYCEIISFFSFFMDQCLLCMSSSIYYLLRRWFIECNLNSVLLLASPYCFNFAFFNSSFTRYKTCLLQMTNTSSWELKISAACVSSQIYSDLLYPISQETLLILSRF